MSYFRAKMYQIRFRLGLWREGKGRKGRGEWEQERRGGENSPLYVSPTVERDRCQWANSSSTTLSVMFIFGARTCLSDPLRNEKPAPEIGARFPVFVARVSCTLTTGPAQTRVADGPQRQKEKSAFCELFLLWKNKYECTTDPEGCAQQSLHANFWTLLPAVAPSGEYK